MGKWWHKDTALRAGNELRNTNSHWSHEAHDHPDCISPSPVRPILWIFGIVWPIPHNLVWIDDIAVVDFSCGDGRRLSFNISFGFKLLWVDARLLQLERPRAVTGIPHFLFRNSTSYLLVFHDLNWLEVRNPKFGLNEVGVEVSKQISNGSSPDFFTENSVPIRQSNSRMTNWGRQTKSVGFWKLMDKYMISACVNRA